MFDCESIFQAGQFSGRHEFLYHKKSTWRNQQNNIYRWFSHSMLPHHVDERWFLASERTDLHEIHSQKKFWFVKKKYVMLRGCIVSSTSNAGKTIFKEKNWATSWIVILVYLLSLPWNTMLSHFLSIFPKNIHWIHEQHSEAMDAEGQRSTFRKYILESLYFEGSSSFPRGRIIACFLLVSHIYDCDGV